MKAVVALVVGLLYCCCVVTAQTVTFNANVAARFMLPCTGASDYAPKAVDECKLLPASSSAAVQTVPVSISWGTGTQSDKLRSNLTFTPFQSITLSTDEDNPVAIGKLEHLNYPIQCYEKCSQAIPTFFQLDLYINVQLTSGGGSVPFEGVFSMFLDETENKDKRGNDLSSPCPLLPGINSEASWVAYHSGYTSDYPCCPYYSDKASPSNLPEPKGGACSDRITFRNVQAPANFTLAGTVYTVKLDGFSPSSSAFSNEITTFTSQENQNQVAYIFAHVVRRCASSNACNDGKNCTSDACVDGQCVYTPVASGTSCVDPPAGQLPYNPANQCGRWKCNSRGTCLGSATNQGGACSPATNSFPAGATSDCTKPRCNSGSCKYSSVVYGSACSQGTLTVPQCQVLRCSSGACVPFGTRNTQTCTPSNEIEQGAISSNADCNNAKCNANGQCVFTALTSGSCTSAAIQTCKKRSCQSVNRSGVNVGSCLYNSNNAQGSCTSTAIVDCKKRTCSGGVCTTTANQAQGSCTTVGAIQDCKKRGCDSSGNCVRSNNDGQGSCTSIGSPTACNKRGCSSGACAYQYNSADVGSCTAVGAIVDCKKRTCFNKGGAIPGSCGYNSNNAQGSCTSTAIVDCKKRTCSGGACTTTANQAQGSCTSVGAIQDCKKRGCDSSGNCVRSNNDGQGSCTSIGSPTACNKRGCSSGACAYQYNSADVGSCTAVGAIVDCKKRSCFNKGGAIPGSCGYNSNNAQGSCTSTAIVDCKKRTCSGGVCTTTANQAQGSCTTVGAIQDCKKRGCNSSGNCVRSNNNNQGSCTTVGSPKLCNNRLCSGGACGYSLSSGSCTTLEVKECSIRQCTSVSGGTATCQYSALSSGTCLGTFDSSLLNSCTKRTCSSGVCVLGFTAGNCNSGLTTNDANCFQARCRTKGAGGTCSTSFRTGNSCTGTASLVCRTRKCTAAGYCKHNNIASGTPCSSSAAGPVGSFCNPQYCDGSGNCANNRVIQEGASCITTADPAAQSCVVSACTAGTCRDKTLWNSLNYSAICKPNGLNEECTSWYCIYGDTSPYNHQATCQKLPRAGGVEGMSCAIPNNQDSEVARRCYTPQCNSSGSCVRVPVTNGEFCDTPTGAVVENGYGCSKYVCQNGMCDTSRVVQIANGSECAGVVKCNPAAPGCLSECQRFTCLSGRCVLNYFNEGNNCTYIKYISARNGEIREVRAESETANDCTTGKCFQGRCTGYSVANGTACGNRTKYNDQCYGDYCDTSGRCVHTGRKDCSGSFPIPSICWDVVCQAADGSCAVVPNGVVDCSCITDCSACTAVFDITNRNNRNRRTLGCWWCTGTGPQKTGRGCYNRYLPGNSTQIPRPTGKGSCYSNSSPCGGDGGLTGGQIAGIVIGILGLTSLALFVIALAILLIRYCTAAGTPPANASLTDLAFDKNVKNNVFYEGACLDQVSALYSEPHFITK